MKTTAQASTANPAMPSNTATTMPTVDHGPLRRLIGGSCQCPRIFVRLRDREPAVDARRWSAALGRAAYELLIVLSAHEAVEPAWEGQRHEATMSGTL